MPERGYEFYLRVVNSIGPLHDPVTWYGINYTGTQITQWDFQNKGKLGWTGASSFVLEVPLRNLRPSVIYSVPCDRIVQRAYFSQVEHEEIKFISISGHVIFCLLYKHTYDDVIDYFLKISQILSEGQMNISEHFLKIAKEEPIMIRSYSKTLGTFSEIT